MPNTYKPLFVILIEELTKYVQFDKMDNPHYNISLNRYAFKQLQTELADFGVEPLYSTSDEVWFRCENITYKFYVKHLTNA